MLEMLEEYKDIMKAKKKFIEIPGKSYKRHIIKAHWPFSEYLRSHNSIKPTTNNQI